MKARVIAISCAVLALALAGAALVFALWYRGAFLPDWTCWNTVSIRADLDGDGQMERVQVEDRRLSISTDSAEPCLAPSEWLVSDAHVGDMDADGAPEIVCLVWKHGSFGSSQPFWVQDDPLAFSQHVFVFRFASGSLHPVWMSSALGAQVASSYLDSQGHVFLTAPSAERTEWAWESWGFVFRSTQSPAELVASTNTATFAAVGDNIAHSGVLGHAYTHESKSYDFSSVYERVAERIANYDVAAVNQETPLVSDYALVDDYPVFGTPDTMADALAGAGFDIVGHATNHANDRGQTGLADTLAYWREHHPSVNVVGIHDTAHDADKASYIQVRGMMFALLDYTYGLNGRALPEHARYSIDVIGDADGLVAQVSKARRSADVVVCFLHIGEEYASEPTDEQLQLAEKLIGAGADAIVCTHTHTLQGVEQLVSGNGKRGLVFYGLGNFVANQNDPRTLLGGCASIEFEQDERSGEVRASSYALDATISHYGEHGTRVYFLEDYNDVLAREHAPLDDGSAVSVKHLESMLADVEPTAARREPSSELPRLRGARGSRG